MIRGEFLELSGVESLPCTTDQVRDAFRRLRDVENVHSYGLMVDGRCVAIGGLIRVHPGCAEGFIVAEPGVLVRHRYLAVQLRDAWQCLTSDYRRLQVAVDIRDPHAISYAYQLGLSPEGVMHAAGPGGEDYILFARVRIWRT